MKEYFDINNKYFDEPHSPKDLEDMKYEKPNAFLGLSSESYLFQMQMIKKLNVKSIFEVGPGEGFCAINLARAGYDYETLDFQSKKTYDFKLTYEKDLLEFDSENHPKKYDLTSAFQVLEHFEYNRFKDNIKKLSNISKKFIFISLPFSCFGFSFNVRLQLSQILSINKKIQFYFPTLKNNRKYREEYKIRYPYAIHYWEIGRKNFPLTRIINDLKSLNLSIVYKGHGPNPFHYFILCKKK